MLRQQKRARPEDAAAEVKELATELKHHSCTRPPERADHGRLAPRLVRPGPRRPSACSCSPPSRPSTGQRALQPNGAPGRSWLAWASDAARDQHQLLSAVSTQGLPGAYRASLRLARELVRPEDSLVPCLRTRALEQAVPPALVQRAAAILAVSATRAVPTAAPPPPHCQSASACCWQCCSLPLSGSAA